MTFVNVCKCCSKASTVQITAKLSICFGNLQGHCEFPLSWLLKHCKTSICTHQKKAIIKVILFVQPWRSACKPFYKATGLLEKCAEDGLGGAFFKVKSRLALSALRTWSGVLIKLEVRMVDISMKEGNMGIVCWHLSHLIWLSVVKR